MALDSTTAYKQVQILMQQSAAAAHAAQRLLSYKDSLHDAWSGKEVEYFDRTINSLISKCRSLEEQIEKIAKDMTRAISDIQAEEAAAAAAVSSEENAG